MSKRIGSLFSGAGGLDMAVQQVFGGEVVWHAEIDKAASKVLAHRFPGVPNLGSVTDIDWAAVPPVDVLCGGFPCQDVSAAGKRAGIKQGTRSGLWSVFAEAIDHLRPRFVVIENVRGLLSATAERAVESGEDAMGDGAGRPVLRAAGAVLGDLCDLGYDAQWTTVAAADVGAPHRRERVFILATDANVHRPGGDGFAAGGVESAQPSVTGGQHAFPAVRSSDKRISAATVSADEPGVALLPTPGTMDGIEKRTTHAGGNLTLQGAVVGVNPVDVERHSRAGRAVGGDEPGVALLPTPRSSDCFGAGQHGDGGMDLRTTVTLLPTPNAQDGNGGGQYSSPGHQSTLPGEARLLCTPSASDGSGGKTSRSGDRIDEPLRGGQAREMAAAWGKYEPAIRRWEQVTGQPAPAPTEPNKNGNPRLSAAFSEWLMGWPAGWVTDPAIGISRNDQLRIVGNGVCPQQAAAALRFLLTICEVTA